MKLRGALDRGGSSLLLPLDFRPLLPGAVNRCVFSLFLKPLPNDESIRENSPRLVGILIIDP